MSIGGDDGDEVLVSVHWRTALQDSRESQSMMEWCRSVDCYWDFCKIVINNNNNKCLEWVSIVILILLVVDGDYNWRASSCIGLFIDVQLSKSHERANRWWNGAAQLIGGEVPVIEIIITIVVCTITNNNNKYLEWVSVVTLILLAVDGDDDWRATTCGCYCSLTYRILTFTREPIDDGMVPLSWLLVRALYNIQQQSQVSRMSEYRDIDSACCWWWRWLESKFLWMWLLPDVQHSDTHERSNRWWNRATQLPVEEIPAHHQPSTTAATTAATTTTTTTKTTGISMSEHRDVGYRDIGSAGRCWRRWLESKCLDIAHSRTAS